jgi:hypothetical protein
MNAGNLATCFAPNLISPVVMDLTTYDPFEPRMVVEFMIGSWHKFSDENLLAEIVRSVRPASSTSSSPYASPPSSPRGGSATATLLSTSSPGEPAKKLAPLPPARKPRSSSAAPLPTNRLRSNTAVADVRSASGSSSEAPGPVRARPPPPQRPSRNNLSYATVRNAGMKTFKTSGSDDADLQAQNKRDALDLAQHKTTEAASLSDAATPNPAITFSVSSSSTDAPTTMSPLPVAKTIFYSSTPPPTASDDANAVESPIQPVLFSLMSSHSSAHSSAQSSPRDFPSPKITSSIPEQDEDIVEEDPPEK